MEISKNMEVSIIGPFVSESEKETELIRSRIIKENMEAGAKISFIEHTVITAVKIKTT